MYNRIFISYAREDFPYADKLYNFLSENGFDPWMDKKNLLVGQNWDVYIQKELRKAHFIIILLSNNSVNKRGYVQRELNQAILYYEEKLDSDIYIIPIKIDSCEIPDKLRKFHWVEYSSTESMNDILNAINFQRESLIKEIEIKKYSSLGLEYEEKSIVRRYGNKSPYMLFEFFYPLFKTESTESLWELNSIIRNSVVRSHISIRTEYFKFMEYEIDKSDIFEQMDSTEYSTIKFSFLSNEFISFTDFNSSYSTGAAHGLFGSSGHNYYMNPLKPFKLEELFNNFEEILTLLRDCIDDKLMLKAKTEYEEDRSEYFYYEDGGLKAVKENFENYYFNENALVFIYNPYELTNWSMGDHHPEITYDELLKLFPNENKLHEFLKLIKAT